VDASAQGGEPGTELREKRRMHWHSMYTVPIDTN